MEPVVYVNSDIKKFYKDNSFIGRIRDKFNIFLSEENFIKELNLSVVSVKLPCNFDEKSYFNNINIARKIVRNTQAELAPKTYRLLDYKFFNKFQKEITAFGVVTSSKLILRNQHKSIRDSCIVIYDASDNILFDTVCSMAKECKYIILLSENVLRANNISEYIIANYGITPIVSNNAKYAFKNANFIITSRNIDIDTKAIVWYLNNKYTPIKDNGNIVNDVTYSVPWNICSLSNKGMSNELLGAILCQMDERDVEKSLKYNGIFFDRIKFNDSTLVFSK